MGRCGIVRNRYGIAQDRYGIVIESLRVVMEFLGIGLGRYGVVSELFEIVYGPSGFLKIRCRILRDRFGSLWVVMGSFQNCLALFMAVRFR